jgi:EAL domain-containing protein (putative c-di-GMP-specific phosphodiesterase class I)
VQARAWRDAGLPVQRVSVNVSPRQLRKPGVVAMFADCAREAGIGLEAIQVEITEGLLIDHADTVEGLLRELDAAGATIALDDFGTGFSSMAYLNRFPIHVIKIDRVFIDGIGRGRGSEAIVQAIVAMSHALGKTVVAEGVETAAQLTFLQALGCDEIQGYYVARPMPAAEFAQFVRARALAPDTAAAPK